MYIFNESSWEKKYDGTHDGIYSLSGHHYLYNTCSDAFECILVNTDVFFFSDLGTTTKCPSPNVVIIQWQ